MKQECWLSMITPIQHNCARSNKWTIAALERWFERKANIVCLQKPQRAKTGFAICRAAYKITKRNRIWTAIQEGSDLEVDERSDLCSRANNDVNVAVLMLTGEKIMRWVMIYDQTDMQSGERQAGKLDSQSVIWPCRTVLKGDFNAHSGRWDLRCHMQHHVIFWEEAIDKDWLEIGNNGWSTHYWTREDHQGKLVINLTSVNRLITKWSLVADNYATRFNHMIIESEVEVNR